MNELQRLISPIYEALDCYNYKLAVSHANKIIKRDKSCHIASALKAYAQTRLGLIEEAYETAIQVKNLKPLDDPTLQALSLTFKNLSLHEHVVELYEYYTRLSQRCIRVRPKSRGMG